jgi:hypothetical protein
MSPGERGNTPESKRKNTLDEWSVRNASLWLDLRDHDDGSAGHDPGPTSARSGDFQLACYPQRQTTIPFTPPNQRLSETRRDGAGCSITGAWPPKGRRSPYPTPVVSVRVVHLGPSGDRCSFCGHCARPPARTLACEHARKRKAVTEIVEPPPAQRWLPLLQRT